MICIFALFWVEIRNEFMLNHTYYHEMFASWQNRGIIFWWVIAALPPLLYFVLSKKKFSIYRFVIFLFVGLLLFWYISLWAKDKIFLDWFFMFFVNTLLLFSLWITFIVWTLAFWNRLSKLIFKFKEYRLQELFLNFGIWLWAFLLLCQIFVWFRIFYPVVAWLLFWVLVFFIIYQKNDLKEYWSLISWIFSSMNKWSFIKLLILLLLVFSLMYYFNWFQLSFIPYSTAWDANHAYMYTPKIIAENHWLLRWNMWTAESMPYLWYMFITFWFGIWSIFSWNWLSPDTIAVSMNFLSWPLCLIFWLALIKEVSDWFSDKLSLSENVKSIVFCIWWTILLLWLCSWMWAFLVFVDNKTDLWVMALTILAILSWFIFIRRVDDEKNKKWFDKETMKYAVISWMFFALAWMAKPSAFIDMAIFWLLMVWLRIDNILTIWLWIISLWIMWLLKVQNAPDFIWTWMWMKLVIVWLIISIVAIVLLIIRKNDKIKNLLHKLSYIVLWWVSLFASLLVFKWPWLAYKQAINDDFSIWNFGKWLFLAYDNTDLKQKDIIKPSALLATNDDLETIKNQNEIDSLYVEDTLNTDESLLSPFMQCLYEDYTDDELKEWTRKAEVTNEDVWRYVWYWWKDLWNNKFRLSYLLLKIFYPRDWKCYWVNKDAKILCENQQYIVNWNIEEISKIKLKEWTPAEELLSSGLKAYNENPDALMDLISDLKTYYQNHSIYRENGIIYMPYRYLVPLNITFNWSLQNLSSYYTDIWFIRIFVFLFTILSLVYSAIKLDKKLFALSLSTVCGWAIRWAIWWWILWYWIWLLMWTTLVVALFIQDLLYEDKKSTFSVVSILVLTLFGVFSLFQFFFNFIRIASQWSSGPFLWFKQSVWEVQIINDDLSVTSQNKLWYSQKDIFDLQFPQYNKFIDYTKDRADNDWVLIAWTYIQYFLNNQRNLMMDWSLSRFWEQWSDQNMCKMYNRLKKSNIKYLVIDPNIASIVMGEWNKSLFYRFFAKINNDWKILERGSLMMLSQLIDDWFAKLLYSNNLWAKYWFTLSDEELKSIFGEMDKDQLVYLRAQLAAARYMDNSNDLVMWISNIFYQRILNWDAISDIADVYWKQVNQNKIINTVNVYFQDRSALPSMVATLNDDERYVLFQYLNIYISLQSNDSSMVNNILMNSLAWWSQLITVELN